MAKFLRGGENMIIYEEGSDRIVDTSDGCNTDCNCDGDCGCDGGNTGHCGGSWTQ